MKLKKGDYLFLEKTPICFIPKMRKRRGAVQVEEIQIEGETFIRGRGGSILNILLRFLASNPSLPDRQYICGRVLRRGERGNVFRSRGKCEYEDRPCGLALRRLKRKEIPVYLL